MTDAFWDIINRHRDTGVLIDTNILLLHVIGLHDKTLIPRFKRTAQFTEGDFDLLSRLLRLFKRVTTTPNILTEVSNLAGQIADPVKERIFQRLAGNIATLDERYVESRAAAAAREFPRLGLTDAGLIGLGREGMLVLTDDFDLAMTLQTGGSDAINFNHLRRFSGR